MPLRIFLLAVTLLASNLASPATEIFPFGSSWKFFLGTDEASNPTDAWRAIGFNDVRWTNGVAPIGYGEQGIVTRLPTSRNRFWLATFFRKPFVIDNPAAVSELKISVRIDDGCAVWINGRDAGRYNLPDGDLSIYTPFMEQLPLGEIEPTVTTLTLKEDIRSLLVAGTNIMTVEAFNGDLFSNDFLFDAALEYTIDVAPPTVVDLIPAAGVTLPSLTQIEVMFDEDVKGVVAGDLLINGTAATNLTTVSDAQYVFDFPTPLQGSVAVSWRPDNNIIDLSEPPNAFQGGTWSYTIDTNAVPPGVVISEFMAENDKGIHDEDGDDSDWIELYNSGFVTVNLEGWHLTSQTNTLAEWRLPAVSLLPRRYLLVFASRKDRTNAAAPLHTNFKLSKGGAYLALVNAKGQVVSEFAPQYPAQSTDVSYGRERDNPDHIGFFSVPTPGAPNSISGEGFAPEVQFSARSQTFTAPFSVALSVLSSNAVIRYTLGTNLPTELSAIYTNPIPITATTLVRARAFTPGLLPGPVRTESYLQLAAEVSSFKSDLPIVILHNFGRGQVPSSTDQFVTVQVFEPKAGASSLTQPPDIAGLGIFHKRGRSTSGLPKASFFLEVQGEFGEDREVSLAGLPSESDWVLYAPNSFDPVLLHNPVAHELMRQMGQYSPRTQFVEVYLQDGSGTPGAITPADYNGVYVLEEKIKVGRNRVDIDKLQPEHVNPPQVTGGYLLSIDNPPPNSRQFYGAGAFINYLEPDYSEISTPQRDAQERYLTEFFQGFNEGLNGPNWTNPATGYAAYLDVPAAINHHLQGVLTFNVDALRLSGYFYKPRDGKLVMGPVWDFDRTQGSADGRDFNPRVWRSTVPDYGTDMFNSDPQIFDNPWYSRLFQDLDFWQKWIDRYQELRRDVLSFTNVDATIDRLADQVRQAQPRDVARWKGAGGADTTPRNGRRSSGGYTYTFPGTYQGEVDFMKVWYSNRMDFIDGQFVTPPQLGQSPGEVTPGTTLVLTGAVGAAIYYTLDGSDPRLPGGNLSTAARPYTTGIPIDRNVRLAARAQDLAHKNLTGANKPPLSSTWSGLVAGTFVVQTPPLVVTEIMYDPPGSNASASDGATFEYLEVRNVGTNTLNLAGFRFTRGVDFVFPAMTLEPGARTVVVQNKTAFQSRYGTTVSMAGVYTGQLDNSGERLTLEGSLQEPILDFSYNNAWFPVTQGLGFSLVVTDDRAPLTNWGNKTHWAPSGTLNGSPGAADSALPVFPTVLVNEVLSTPQTPQVDAVELFNSGSVEASIGGWFLTDDPDEPGKYRIPDGTVLPPNGYRIFTENDFNADPKTGFRFSSEGDAAYLFSADATGHLTGYAHGFSFDGGESGISFGRYVSSTAAEHFVAQTNVTMGATNAGPKVGPIVINEIMFHPSALAGATNNTRDEFIELHNISPQPVALSDPNAPTNTWQLRGGVDFDFKTGLTLPAGGYLLVVGFDPIARPADLEAFRARYQLGSEVPIVGPWSGQLQNSGERVRLFKPRFDALGNGGAGSVTQILVDEVEFSNAPPWPAHANETGNSLQRIASPAYGNDPVNWLTGLPTPGRPNAATDADSDSDGLPDHWETAQGLNPTDATGDDGANADPDGDGFTNLQEYLSGTAPRSAASYFHVESLAYGATGLQMRFTAAAGKSYSVLSRADLQTGGWSKLTDIPASATAREITVDLGDPGSQGGPEAFYQVVTPVQP